MNHLEFAQMENFQSKDEKEWLSWVGTVEAMLGHDLDGDQSENGYSIGYAYDNFKLGVTTTEYVKGVRSTPHYSVFVRNK